MLSRRWSRSAGHPVQELEHGAQPAGTVAHRHVEPGDGGVGPAGRPQPPEAVGEAVRISTDLGQHAAWIAEYVELGFDQVYVHHVGKEQLPFLDAFGEHVLPQLDVAAPAPAVAIDPRRPGQAPQPAVLP